MSAVDVRPSAIEGLGLFAARPFRAGQRIREVNVVREITPDAPLRPELGERADHCDYPDGKVVLIGTPDRHLNHSCDPNAYLAYEGEHQFIVARRDIAPGEEITCDYNVNIAGGTAWPCHCGTARCLGTVMGDFFLLPEKIQREYQPLLAPWFVRRHGDRLKGLAPTLLPRVLLLSAVVIWGWTFVATKILVAEIGPVEVFALRLAIGLPFLGIVLLLKRVPLRFTREDAGPLLLGGAIFTLHFLVQIAGIVTTTATNTAWIIAASPLALAVLSYLLLHERIGRGGVAGIAVATAGILLLVSRGQFGNLGWLQHTGDWLVLVSAHTWALYTVATRNLVRRRDPLAVTFAILLIAAAFTGVVFAASGNWASVRALSPRGIAALLYLAIPGLALGQWFWQEGVASLGATRAGLYLYLEPLATLALAIPLLGEPFGLFVALGGSLVLAGVYVGQRERGTI